ncbi:MAG: ATP-binding protein [Thermodesulfobacteriota bacterium]|nr:ATP-binding protein [Thermodesulfobacteriota bacterium]
MFFKKKLIPNSVILRTTLGVILLVVVVTITYSLVFLYQSRIALIEAFKLRGISLAKNLALNSELGLLLEDKESLLSLSQNLLREDIVHGVKIEGLGGEILVNLEKKRISPWLKEVFVFPVRLTTPQEKITDDMNIFYEGETRKVKPLGKVEVIISREKVKKTLTKIAKRIFLFAIFVTILAGSISYYLTIIFLKPIKQLSEASADIASGNWERRVEIAEEEELAQLTNAFNQMSSSLVDKRRELEDSYKKLAKKERMAEIGRLFTMIAHEFKNPLGIIKGSVDILIRKKLKSDTKITMLEYINEEVSRLNRLVEDFLTFARPFPPRLDSINILEIIKKLVDGIEKRDNLGKNIKTKVILDTEIPLVNADEHQIYQALLNLIQNSLEAIEEDGKIEIICYKERYQEEDGVSIEIADNGPGVFYEDREKIFELFYTKKKDGSGLGLAIANKIAENHGGYIKYKETNGEGARFVLWLPLKGQAST